MDYNFWTFILNNFKINFRRRHYILWILHAKFYLMWPKCVQWQAPRCLAVFSRTFCKLSVNIALVLFSEFWYFGVLGSHLVHCFTVVQYTYIKLLLSKFGTLEREGSLTKPLEWEGSQILTGVPLVNGTPFINYLL